MLEGHELAEGARYTRSEEIANAVSHGIGVVLAIAGLTVLVAFASLRGSIWEIVGVSIYGTSMTLMYTTSTLYHAIPLMRAKRVLRILDHSGIFVAIAGTYTPFALSNLRGPWGWSLFAAVWTLAALGIVLKIRAIGRLRALSVALYVGMGWLVVVAARPMLAHVAPGGIALLVAGGLVYTAGIGFYVARRMRFSHFFWHLCVLTASGLHYFAVLLFVVLRAR